MAKDLFLPKAIKELKMTTIEYIHAANGREGIFGCRQDIDAGTNENIEGNSKEKTMLKGKYFHFQLNWLLCI